jgi:hypothetical protein
LNFKLLYVVEFAAGGSAEGLKLCYVEAGVGGNSAEFCGVEVGVGEVREVGVAGKIGLEGLFGSLVLEVIVIGLGFGLVESERSVKNLDLGSLSNRSGGGNDLLSDSGVVKQSKEKLDGVLEQLED